MTDRDEQRAACIEAMARANHKAYDRLGPDQQRRLRKTAAKYLDSIRDLEATPMIIDEHRKARIEAIGDEIVDACDYDWDKINKAAEAVVDALDELASVLPRKETEETVENLAEAFHKAFRKHQDLAPPWSGISDANKAGVIAGVKAVLAVVHAVGVTNQPEQP